ncbi:U-box domain-containing protein 21 [Ricinus communis]|uniref:U-box domain-containing protein n=1 Tax=Ricinus communis TaxID=3988 RepID=B9T6A7_RICCO|nr:U-box domain-containing protein 21 [Ricinus communis]EEF28606.1 ubiquitin-protein ligase, putative [Ricinus communis]|eukprot:XP_002533776.1 U-box domain-containing protein 21 [Ricinus communis]
MVFGWRRNRSAAGKKPQASSNMELVIPNHYLCPISLDLMKDPVTLSSGITYDRESIEAWLEAGNFTCPVTGLVLRSFDQIPNHTLRAMIQEWCVEHRRYGVERIPTPRVPVSPIQVSETLSCLDASTKRLDQYGCVELVQKIKRWSSESERNRRCIVANGASGVLAAAFSAFSRDSSRRNDSVLEEILSAIAPMMLPMSDSESQIYLSSPDSLCTMVRFLEHGDLSSKQNSIIALKELLSSDEQHAEALASFEEVHELLFKFIKDPVCPKITKASLVVIFHLLSSHSSGGNIKSTFAKMGLVPLIIGIIIGSERSICEGALGVLDKLCDCEEGREEAYSNALTWPVLVKKILRVSELATQYSVSAIWKLNKYGRKEKVLVEALQVGAFQKLVLLLQVGCGNETKEKATELLKLMNPYRSELECIESVDFKNLKRSF